MAGHDDLHIPATIPLAGRVVSTLLSMITITTLAICFTRRVIATHDWSRVPLTRWLTFAIYIDSIIFIICTTVLEGALGLNSSTSVCSASILICLTCYLTTKALIFYFLIEKVYIIRRIRTPRLKSKLYCFNCFGMLAPYCAIIVLNFVYRVAYFDDGGMCIIGMQVKSVMPLIISDALINFYLTLLFVIPLRGLYSYKNSPNSVLRTITIRSFIGSCGTLTSSVVNLTVLMVLHGEASWICLMCCTSDILFSVLVLHWVTSKDSSLATPTPTHSANTNPHQSAHTNSCMKSPKHELFDIYSRPSDGVHGTVTTHITTGKEMVTDDDEKDIEMGKIVVQTGQVIERDSQSSAAAEEDTVRRSHRSTEELVDKEPWAVR